VRSHEGSKIGEETELTQPVYDFTFQLRADTHGVVLCTVHRNEEHARFFSQVSGNLSVQNAMIWASTCVIEPIHSASSVDQLEQSYLMVVSYIPSFDRFRPRLFSSVRELCSALSSRSLPELKIKFQKSKRGIPIEDFVPIIFRQLYSTIPKVADESEAPYAVAMIQEMFQQIGILLLTYVCVIRSNRPLVI
jgi:hypothetical protein